MFLRATISVRIIALAAAICTVAGVWSRKRQSGSHLTSNLGVTEQADRLPLVPPQHLLRVLQSQ